MLLVKALKQIVLPSPTQGGTTMATKQGDNSNTDKLTTATSLIITSSSMERTHILSLAHLILLCNQPQAQHHAAKNGQECTLLCPSLVPHVP